MKFNISESERNEILRQHKQFINEQGGGASIGAIGGSNSETQVQNTQQPKNYTVQEIQNYLNKMGNYGLNPDGVLGPQTIKMYNDYISKMVKVPEAQQSDVRTPKEPESALLQQVQRDLAQQTPEPPPIDVVPEPQQRSEPEITLDGMRGKKSGGKTPNV